MARADSSMVGTPKYERVENDWYPTEPDCTLAVYKFLAEEHLLSMNTIVYEPACGDGAISNVFTEKGHTVHSSDLYPQMEGAATRDFLNEPVMVDHESGCPILFITNPPYQMPYIDQFMDQMLDLVHNDGVTAAMLMRNELDCALSRRKFFQDCPYYYGKLVLTWRPRWIPGSTGSPRHNYAWYIWSKHATDPVIQYGFRGKKNRKTQ